MFDDPSSQPRFGLRNYLIVSSGAIFLAALYVGAVFYSRWKENRELEQESAEQRRAQDARTVQAMGSDRFAILGLYANPTNIHSGDTADICYSVSNAKRVTLQPQDQPVWPAFSHCVQVAPRKTTNYTFTAQDAAGHTNVEAVEIKVR